MRSIFRSLLIFAIALSSLSSLHATAVTPGVATIVHQGASLPVGAAQFSIFVLNTGTPTLYICNANPCTTSGNWVAASGAGSCTGCANSALSNIAFVAIGAPLLPATGFALDIGGAAGTSGTAPTDVVIQGGLAFSGSNTQFGGEVDITGGQGQGTTGGGGGNVVIQGGPASAGPTGNVLISGGIATGTNNTGLVSLFTSQAGTGGTSGGIFLQAALGPGNVNTGSGNITMQAGDVTLEVGAGTAGHGEIDFINANGSSGIIDIQNFSFSYATDNTYDFDLSNKRPHDMWIGDHLFIGSTTAGFSGTVSNFTGPLMAVSFASGTNSFLCTDGSVSLGMTTACPTVITTPGTLVSGNYPAANGVNTIGDSGVTAGPYTCQWLTFPTTSGTGDALSGTGNRATIWKVWLGTPCVTTGVTYAVGTADNTSHTYDLGLFSAAGTLLAHTGSTAGTTFAASTGAKDASWLSSTTLQPGIIYIGLTSSCTSTCATLAGASGNALSRESNAVVTVSGGGSFSGGISPPGDTSTSTANTPAILVR